MSVPRIIPAMFRSIWTWIRGRPEAESGFNSFAADVPIRRSADDLLGRGEFARALAKVLYRHRGEDSLVVALRGHWGAGKTSIKNMVVEMVRSEKSGPMRVVEFNPWQWSGDEAITRAFFREITAALGDSDRTLKGRRRADEFRRYAKKLEQFSGGIKSASDLTTSLVGWFGGIGLLLAGAGLVTLTLPATVLVPGLLGLSGFILLTSKLLGWFGRDREDDRPLDIARARLEDRLKSLPRNILVVIDDIDRLEPDEIKLVIRHVKANANLPGLTYLLLFQKDMVESAFDGAEKGSGSAYLEKIVQAAFDVPVVEGTRIERFILAELEKIASQNPNNLAEFDAVRWGNIWQGGLRHFFRNLRDGRRFIGGVEVQFELHRGARVLEANMIDVVALEAIRLFEPKLFTSISRSRRLLCE